jgi:hypothetical protein
MANELIPFPSGTKTGSNSIFTRERLIASVANLRYEAVERKSFAAAGGKAGSKVRNEKLSAKRRREIAKAAAEARWKKKRP